VKGTLTLTWYKHGRSRHHRDRTVPSEYQGFEIELEQANRQTLLTLIGLVVLYLLVACVTG
jgi:hypothetical protein